MGAFAGIQTRRLLRLLFRLISFDRAVPQTEFFPSEKIAHGSLRRLSNVNMVAHVPHRFKREKRARHGFVVKIRGNGRDARAGRGQDAGITQKRQLQGQAGGTRGRRYPSVAPDLASLELAEGRRRARLPDSAEEAAARAGVAGRALGGNEREQRIGIAIVAQLDELLGVSAGGALMPQFLATARPKHRLAAFERERKRFFAHPRHHEHFERACILHDAGYKPVRIVSKLRQVHEVSLSILCTGRCFCRTGWR